MQMFASAGPLATPETRPINGTRAATTPASQRILFLCASGRTFINCVSGQTFILEELVRVCCVKGHSLTVSTDDFTS